MNDTKQPESKTPDQPSADRATPQRFAVPQAFAANGLDQVTYQQLYAESLADPEGFWARQAQRLDWIKPFSQVKEVSYAAADLHIRWYADGQLNVASNCLDRHLAERADKTAILWEGDEPGQQQHISYRQLHRRVCQLANGLRQLGIGKGDVVTIYLPMVPEAAVAMLACARIGAVHSVVFAGFSPEALAGRVQDCQSKLIITADTGRRGGKLIPLKANVDAALEFAPVPRVLVLKRGGEAVDWFAERDLWWHELVDKQSEDCEAQPMGAEDPLFILYTSGSTGKPKGVLHTCGGYLVYASLTHEQIFALQEQDVYWCTADVGWITGHSYIVYGPLANGATTLMFEGVPSYPDPGRFWQIVDKHQVTIFYTAPTAIRALMREGEAWVRASQRTSLRLLGSVGEPINPEAWLWYHRVVGDGRCPIVDTWWQTETGGVLISPLPGATELKPGSATLPLPGVQPALVDNEGHLLRGEAEGNLVLMDSWPGQMRSVYGDHSRFIKTYFQSFPGYYFTGDGARRDAQGYYWITGRVDDVLNVSGHRLGTAEIESALVAHKLVVEAAVVGYPDDLKGQGVYAYVTLVADTEGSTALVKELKDWVRKHLSPIAVPQKIQWAPGLPKTRSGKIMRRILRKIAANEYETLGDTSTLADPSVVDELIVEHQSL